jgi:hypothetical protein
VANRISNQPEGRVEAPRRGTRAESSAAPRLMKSEERAAVSTAEKMWGGADSAKSLEVRAAEIEAAERADKEEGGQLQHESNAKAEKGNLFKVFAWQKGGPAKPQTPAKPPNTGASQSKLPQVGTKPGNTATSAANLPRVGPSATSTSSSKLQPLNGVRQALIGEMARAERPPDAFGLLRDAKPAGELFVEDALADGHSEDQEDPELAAAVEECIAKCFGVRGILRIGPGHNDKLEPIIVVSVTQGFTEASFAAVPEKVHRFPTLVAIPFELLPLKKDR